MVKLYRREGGRKLKIFFDQKEADRLTESFVTVSGISISLFDCNLNLLSHHGQDVCGFCRKMRENPEFTRRCTCSNENAFRQAEALRATYLYQCHAGLTEMVTPVINRDMVIGYLMIGQFIPAERKEQAWENVQHCCREFASFLPEREVFDREVRALTQKEIQAWTDILQAYTSYLWVNRCLLPKVEESFERIRQDVREHIQEPLSAHSIGKRLHIPKNRMYETVKRNTGLTLSEYIRSVRMELARELLLHTDLSITEIAEKTGIPDYSYFTKLFRQYTGKTPSAFHKGLTSQKKGEDLA